MKKVLFLIFGFLFIPCFIFAQTKIEINTASQEELETLTGIGPVYAQRIIENRPFSFIDDLLRVSGIGEKTLQKIKNQGLAYVSSQITPVDSEKSSIKNEEPAESPNAITNEIKKISPNSKITTPTIYPFGIIFTGVMPAPEGPDAENEWIKIKNTNNFEIDLTDWEIRDIKGSIKTYTLKQKIKALEVLTLMRPETKITLNNTGDGLELLNPTGEIVDFVVFEKAPANIAYVKIADAWQWEGQNTEQKESLSNYQASMTGANSVKKEISEINLSSGKEIKGFNYSLLITGIIIASVSGAIIISLRKKLKEDYDQ